MTIFTKKKLRPINNKQQFPILKLGENDGKNKGGISDKKEKN